VDGLLIRFLSSAFLKMIPNDPAQARRPSRTPKIKMINKLHKSITTGNGSPEGFQGYLPERGYMKSRSWIEQ
jgi:hypothetical protein